MNPEQIKQALLGLMGSSGPLVTFFVQVLGYPSEKVVTTLNLLAAITPIVWLGVQLYRSRKAGLVLATKASVPEVATVVIKDGTAGELGKIAASNAPGNRDVVTETQNEIDAKLGTKV